MARIQMWVPDWLDRICAWPMMGYRRWKYGYAYRRINLGEGRYTIVDESIYYQLNPFHWYATGEGIHIYAMRNIIKPGCKTKCMRMSREIMNAPDGLLVDHKNKNTLDNRRDNLRLATHAQNMQNRGKWRSNTSSRFVGVSFHKKEKRWCAYIQHQGKSKHLGRFKSETAAAKAYDEAAKKYHGEFAQLNFDQKPVIHILKKPG